MYETIINVIVKLIESIAAMMIAAAVASALWRLLLRHLPFQRAGAGETAPHDVRLQLGQHLVLALEFMIAADILKTVLAPTLQDLAYLGGIILIRTVLSVSIAYELRRGKTPSSAGYQVLDGVHVKPTSSQHGCPY